MPWWEFDTTLARWWAAAEVLCYGTAVVVEADARSGRRAHAVSP